MGEVFDDCMDATVDALIGKEASVKVKRYEYYTPPVWDMDSYMREKYDGDWVRFDDYDALLVLARRLRMVAMGLYKTEDDTDYDSVIDDSKWLEE